MSDVLAFIFFVICYGVCIVQDETKMFSVIETKKKFFRQTLRKVYKELEKKGYNPINQLIGYILSGDPTYVTNQNGARALVGRIDRDELLKVLLEFYLKNG